MNGDDIVTKTRPGHFDRFTLFNLNVAGVHFKRLELWSEPGAPGPVWAEDYDDPVPEGTARSYGPPEEVPVPEPQMLVYRFAFGGVDQPDETIVAPPGEWLFAAQAQVLLEIYEDFESRPRTI